MTIGNLRNSSGHPEIGCLERFCDSTIPETDQKYQSDLIELLNSSYPGSMLVVPKLSHLANSVQSLSAVIKSLGEKQIVLRALHEDIESTDAGAEYFFLLIDVFATVEKSMIDNQLSRSRSRMKSKLNGRRPKLSMQQRKKVSRDAEQGCPILNVAREFGISRSIVHAYTKKFCSKGNS